MAVPATTSWHHLCPPQAVRRNREDEVSGATPQTARRRPALPNPNGLVPAKQSGKLRDGALGQVIGGTQAGRSGTVRDINTSKTGHVTITVAQANGERFKTLAKSVVIPPEPT